MKFIDLRIGKYFKLLKFNEENGTYVTHKLVKTVPRKNIDFDVFNRYNLTTERYQFINPDRTVKELNNPYE